MVTVRFASGVAVQYNAAQYLIHGEGAWKLYTANPANGGTLVVAIQASAGAIVELYPACRVEDPAHDLTNERALRLVAERIREFSARAPQLAAQLKVALRAFNAKTRRWQDQ